MREILTELNSILSFPLSLNLPGEEYLEIASVLKRLEQKYEAAVLLPVTDLKQLYH